MINNNRYFNKEEKEFEVSVQWTLEEFEGQKKLIISNFPYRIIYLDYFHFFKPLNQIIASITGFATCINFPFKDIEVKLRVDGGIPKTIQDIMLGYNSQQDKIHLEVDQDNIIEDETFEGLKTEYDRVILLSGGKDSAYALWKSLKLSGKILCLYIKGLNVEYLKEMKNAKQIAKKYGVDFKVIGFENYDTGDYSLSAIRRAIWRDMLLISIARQFSNKIMIGETYDPAFHELKDDVIQENNILNFGATKFVLSKLENLLSCKISIAPNELDLYKDLKNNNPELLSITRSCFNPFRNCSPSEDWENSCIKCRTLYFYDLWIDNEVFQEKHIEFLNSPWYLGPIELREQILKKNQSR
ncbi:MAG: hypothetical protein ACTSYI_17740 [Promethearchaeota archaeon]